MTKEPLGVCDRLLSAHAKDRHSWTPEWSICADMCINWRPVEASAPAASPVSDRCPQCDDYTRCGHPYHDAPPTDAAPKDQTQAAIEEAVRVAADLLKRHLADTWEQSAEQIVTAILPILRSKV